MIFRRVDNARVRKVDKLAPNDFYFWMPSFNLEDADGKTYHSICTHKSGEDFFILYHNKKD